MPRGVRSRLARANVLSTRLLYFERRPPARYPRRALASITTHDLPTLAGAGAARTSPTRRPPGLTPDAAGLALLRSRVGCRRQAFPRPPSWPT